MRNWIENLDTGQVRIRTHGTRVGWREQWNGLLLRIDLEVAKYEGSDEVFQEWEVSLLEKDLAYDEYDEQQSIRLAHGSSLELVMEQLATVAFRINKSLHRMGPMAYSASHEKLKAYDSETVDALRIQQAGVTDSGRQFTVDGVIEAHDQVLKDQSNASRVAAEVGGWLTISNPLKGGESGGTETERGGDGQDPEESGSVG